MSTPHDLPPELPPKLPGARDQNRRDRSRHNRSLTNARNALFGALGVLWLYAAGLVIAAIIMHLGGRSAMAWPTTGMAALAIVSALMLYRFPLTCTVGLAAFHTAWTVWSLTQGEAVRGMQFMAVVLWITIPIAKMASDVLATDDRAADRLRGEYQTTAGVSEVRDRAETRRFISRQQSYRTWIIMIIGMVGVPAIGLTAHFFVHRPTPPPPFEEPLARWETAFESGDLAAAKALCTSEYQSRWSKVMKILERESWAEGVELGEPEMRRQSDVSREVHFALPRGTMKTAWVVEEGAWRARRVVFSRVRER